MKIKVKKDYLQKVLEDNKAKHVALFKETYEEYRLSFYNLLQKQYAEYKSTTPKANEFINPFWKLAEPQSHERDYDHAIAMVAQADEDLIELDSSDFQKFVKDDWDWKQDFMRTSNSYGKGI